MNSQPTIADGLEKTPTGQESAEKHPQGTHQKAPTGQDEKAPEDYPQYRGSVPVTSLPPILPASGSPVPSVLLGVISDTELKHLLSKNRQTEWDTRIRRHGLLALIDSFTKRRTKTGFSCSHMLARQYISKLRQARDKETSKDPLLLLRRIGILKIVQRAVCAYHTKTSHRYDFTPEYAGKNLKLSIKLAPGIQWKREHAAERKAHRLNQLNPFRAQLLVDLHKVRWHDDARPLIVQLKDNPEKEWREVVDRVVDAVDGPKHFVNVSIHGHITTSLSSCMKQLQPMLLLDGERMVKADISYAHHCLLPSILMDRIVWLQDKGRDVSEHKIEYASFVAFLSKGDYYRKLSVDPESDAARDDVKNIINFLLNQRTEKAKRFELYRKIRAQFPLTFNVVEAIKRDDHRNISKQLRRKLSDVVNGALEELQGRDIRAIPLADCLFCQESKQAVVSETLARWLYEKTGVNGKAGGLRHRH